ncbi:MAG: outer membrane protein assembly factor BamD [Thermodesulfobacteriota bacterium]|nr:outer membrane protein assembly factor BamD [Thermodesulfobacteriota bacterium]
MKRKLLVLILMCVLVGCAHKIPQEKSPLDLFNEAQELASKGTMEKAVDAFMKVRTIYPAHELAGKSLLAIADTYFDHKEYESGLGNYKEFMLLYPTDPDAGYCLYRIGMCHFNQMSTYDRDQSQTAKAINTFKELLARYPNSPYGDDASSKLKEAELIMAKHYIYIGKFYLKKHNYKAACARFRQVQALWPDIAKDEEINELISKACKE